MLEYRKKWPKIKHKASEASCVWGSEGSVEGLRVSSISSKAMEFAVAVLNALAGMGKYLEKGKKGAPKIKF